MRRRAFLIASASIAVLPTTGRGQGRFFVASDGTRLHVAESGPARAPAIVFVPGWRMPAWIFQPQIAYFSTRYRVLALDPRGQGASDVPESGYDYIRRGQDVAETVARAGPGPVLLVGWSLGVLDSLAYLRAYGDSRIAGLVLIDNSVGEDPPPPPRVRPPRAGPPVAPEVRMRRFVASMFRHPPGQEYLDRLTEATLRMPESAAGALLSYPVPRTYWRDSLYATQKPALYVVRPTFAGQAENLARKHPSAETAVFRNAGHALFVDEPERFNALMDDFIRRRVWPAAPSARAATPQIR